VIGNGDIASAADVKRRMASGVRGIMIGRAAMCAPWIFREIKHYLATGEILAPPTIEERVAACRKHFLRSLEWKGPFVGVVEMRRHYSQYFKGLDHFKDFRMQLVTLNSKDEILGVLDQVAAHYAAVA
jgi:tRNA-dihydrouridine synthase